MPADPAVRTGGVLSRRVVPHLRLVCAGMLGVGSLWACGDKDTAQKLSAEDIDRASARTDSILAAADLSPASVLDSLRESMRAQLDSAAVTTTSADGVIAPSEEQKVDEGGAASVGREMSRRAQARGDSMARAMAMRLAAIDEGGNRARGDSLRGVLAWQGTEPARSVVLRQGDATVTLSGMATTGLSRLVGTEVMVRGVKVTPRDIVVSDFVVRAADGVPAYDGVLESDGTMRLTDGSGVRRVPLPEPLRELTGTRVWVAVKNGRATSYGFIRR
ncbi:MAG: hypothetical protein IBJ03_18865 [Gemmatimonadaceae bacterium]|nr:hypothetical protein [Gemmatimonadaceae bacterium]